MTIQHVIGIDGYTLLVYRSSDHLYRFSIADFSGTAFNFDNLFLTAEEAKMKGRDVIENAFSCDRRS
jgi:hypothetical protein